MRAAPASSPSAYEFRRLLPAFAILLVVAPLLPVLRNEFLNWDDLVAVVQNPHLRAPGIASWAFTTTLLDHYQPATWLVWAAVSRVFGLEPWAFHALSLVCHALNATLVYVLALRLAQLNSGLARDATPAAAIAASIFAVHPVHAETVAWVSAFPYLLALTFLLLSVIVYLNYCAAATRRTQAAWLLSSFACYLFSLLSRETAFAFPAILLCVDVWLLGRRVAPGRLLLEKAPYALMASGGLALEAHARTFASFAEVGFGVRAELALKAPYVYLGRALMPFWLSPVYPLPIASTVNWLRVSALSTVSVLLCVALVAQRKHRSGLACGVIAFLLLLSPALGVAPSGVQASADRYLYVPFVPLAMLIGAACASAIELRPRSVTAMVATATVLLALVTFRQASFWHDSVSIWSRAVQMDRQNDVATFNLAAALAEAGRTDDAITWYTRTLELLPAHAQARKNVDLLLANKSETEGAALASSGRFSEAIARYSRVLALDPTRTHARAARGIAFSRTQSWSEAAVDLAEARSSGVVDLEVANSLALSLVHLDRYAEAIGVMKDALRQSPAEVNIAHNLARLLLDVPDQSMRDAMLAVSLARHVCELTKGQDARAFDTLAAAYAATGQRELALESAVRGVGVATGSGDIETAAALRGRIRMLRLNPPGRVAARPHQP